MKTFFSAVALSLTLFLFSCQKEVTLTDPNAIANGNTGTGANTRTSYHPLTTDSWWKYKDSITSTTSLVTATNVKKTFGNISYNAVITAMGTQKDTAWFASPQPNYFVRGKGISPNGAPYDILFHYLNDTAQVGHSWQYDAGHGNGFTALITTTIVAKGLTMAVAGKTYNDIIQTRLDLAYDIMGATMDFGTYDYFIAKGVGIVKVRSKLGMMGMVMLETCTDLIDYNIK